MDKVTSFQILDKAVSLSQTYVCLKRMSKENV